MKVILKSSIVSVTFLFASFLLPLHAKSLSEALVESYNNSGLLDQNRALLRAADENTIIASSALLPIVSWAANFRETGAKLTPQEVRRAMLFGGVTLV